SPTTSVTFATSCGSVENLNVSDRHGATPYAFQARATVLFTTPRRAARSREDQCVTPSFFGGGFSVCVMTRSWSINRGRPDRGASNNPATPLREYRARQDTTVCRDTPTRAAISVFDTPSAANSTIRARCARPALSVEARVHDINFV